jgi:hypothetical protein
MLISRGQSLRSISLSTGISRATLRDWRDHPERSQSLLRHCPRCAESPTLPEPGADYAYLLGQYLGDGCISATADAAKGVWSLRIACADAWPGVMAECISAISAIRPGNKVGTVQAEGCTVVVAYSRHWPCLFPQHGPGMKHNRKIELELWQRTITGQHPAPLPAGYSTPTVAGSPIACADRYPAATGGTNTRGTCSPMSRATFSRSVAARSISSESAGDSPGGTPFPSPAERPWRGLTSSWGRNTDAAPSGPGPWRTSRGPGSGRLAARSPIRSRGLRQA